MEDNLMLIDRVHSGDRKAYEILCRENMNLVRSIALRFSGRGCELCDLIQIGCVGLLKAISGFDTSRGLKFSTYAVPVICGEIKRFLRDDGMIHISRGLKEKKYRAAVAEEQLRKTLCREPTVSEIAEKSGICVPELMEAYNACRGVDSYDRPVDDEEFSMQFSDNSVNEDVLIDRITVKQLLDGLSERERRVVVMRYMEGKTQGQIAKAIGVSQVHISRIEKGALLRMRAMVTE